MAWVAHQREAMWTYFGAMGPRRDEPTMPGMDAQERFQLTEQELGRIVGYREKGEHGSVTHYYVSDLIAHSERKFGRVPEGALDGDAGSCSTDGEILAAAMMAVEAKAFEGLTHGDLQEQLRLRGVSGKELTGKKSELLERLKALSGLLDASPPSAQPQGNGARKRKLSTSSPAPMHIALK